MRHAGVCRRCEAPVVWAYTRNNRRIPVEPATISLDDVVWVETLEGDEAPLFEIRRGHVTHFARCPAGRPEGRSYKGGRYQTAWGDWRGEGDGPRAEAKPAGGDGVLIRTSDEAFSALHLFNSAPGAVISAAYKALVKLHHPDVGGSEETMTRINLAYELLQKFGFV